ncbi:MAG: RagB/SusD family nutrient uptake outer membrane protein [Odoribacter sp.]
MKRLKNIIFILSLALFVASCTNWLDVQPKTEVKQDKMFENEAGFKDALIGAYMLMGDTMIYGRELTHNFLEVLAQQYDMVSTSNLYYQAKLYSYNNLGIEAKINTIWSKIYRVIANLNAVLENIEMKKNVLHPTNYANIKAEALGLRAFLHFDLLRMFGWGDIVNNPSNLDRLCIPYVTRYSKEMTKQSTVKEILGYIHTDLNEAEQLLSYYDLYNQVAQEDDYELPNDDKFYSERRSRFNYYAARATQARVYMWEGKYKEALERVSLFTQKGAEKIQWVDLDRSVINAELVDRDLTFTTEHIFNLDVHSMYPPLKSYIEQFQIHGSFTVQDNTLYFYHTKLRADALYEVTKGGANDQRNAALYERVDNTHYLFLKFKEAPNSKSPAKNKMPLIKKAEMFYYAAECYNRQNEPGKAIELLNEVRAARGIDRLYALPSTLTTAEVDNEILKEWKKEYLEEGQMFYYYKRLGLQIPDAGVSGDAAFVLPLPKSEIDLGGREDYKKD